MITLLGPSQSPQIKIVAEGCDPCANVKNCVSKVIVPQGEAISSVVVNVNGENIIITVPTGGDPASLIAEALVPYALVGQGDITYVLDQDTNETILTLFGQAHLVAVFADSGEVTATLMCDIVTECTYKLYVPGGLGQILNVDSNTYNILDFTIGTTPIGDVVAFYQSVFTSGVVVTVTENTVIGKYEVSLTYAGNHQISFTSGGSTTSQIQCSCKSLYVDLNNYDVFTIAASFKVSPKKEAIDSKTKKA
jgi:hypothetical protein